MIVHPFLQQLMLVAHHEIFVLKQEWMKGMAIWVVKFPMGGIQYFGFLAIMSIYQGNYCILWIDIHKVIIKKSHREVSPPSSRARHNRLWIFSLLILSQKKSKKIIIQNSFNKRDIMQLFSAVATLFKKKLLCMWKLDNPYCHKLKGDAFVSKLVGMKILNLAMNKCVEIVEILVNLNSLQTEFPDIYKHWLHKKPTMIMKNFDCFLLLIILYWVPTFFCIE